MQIQDHQRILRIWNRHPFQGGKLLGSGFALSSHHVVTCRHVVDHSEGSGAGRWNNIFVDGVGLSPAQQVERGWLLPERQATEVDLALLELRVPPSIPSWLGLTLAGSDDELMHGGSLSLFGFGSEMESARLVPATISSFFPQLATYLVSAHVPHGMSGGPAVSGDVVVGVIKARDPSAGVVDVIPVSYAHQLLKRAKIQVPRRSDPYPDRIYNVPPKPPVVFGRTRLTDSMVQKLVHAPGGSTFFLHGPTGVGKTTLVAHLLREPAIKESFRDGILWAAVGDGREREGFLLGWASVFDVHTIAASTNVIAERKEIILGKIRSRRILFVSDGVTTRSDAEDHIIGGNCVNLLTTQDPEVARGLGHLVRVPKLDAAAALDMVQTYAPVAAAQHRGDATKLIRSVGSSTVALNIVANQLSERKVGSSKNTLTTALEVGRAKGPNAVIVWRIEALNVSERQALQALCVFRAKPHTFSKEAAIAVMNNNDVDQLNTLLRSGLIEDADGRYSMHQTIKSLALERLSEPELESNALLRMITFYVEFVEAHRTNPNQLAIEMVNINSALKRAIKIGSKRLLIRGANAYCDFLRVQGLNDLGQRFLKAALVAARELGDVEAQAGTAVHLAHHWEKLGEYPKANNILRSYRQEEELVKDPVRWANACYLRAVVAYNIGHFQEASDHIDRGLIDLTGSAWPQIDKVLESSSALDAQRDYASATSQLLERKCLVAIAQAGGLNRDLYIKTARQAGWYGWRIARRLNDLSARAEHLLNLAWLHLERGKPVQAERLAEWGLKLAIDTGHLELQAGLRHRLGMVALQQGNFKRAKDEFAQGLEIARSIHHRWYISLLCSSMGWILLRGSPKRALEAFEEAHRVAIQLGSPDLSEAAFIGLARLEQLTRNRRSRLRSRSPMYRERI